MEIQCIILVALPASGKTKLCETYKELGYLIYDDFLQQFYNGEILEKLEQGNKVCLADPRLCIKEVFDRFIKKIQEFTENYFIICFENNPEHCLLNNLERYSGKDKQMEQFLVKEKLGKDNDIMRFSKLYDLSFYKRYPHKIIPVYIKQK